MANITAYYQVERKKGTEGHTFGCLDANQAVERAEELVTIFDILPGVPTAEDYVAIICGNKKFVWKPERAKS